MNGLGLRCAKLLYGQRRVLAVVGLAAFAVSAVRLFFFGASYEAELILVAAAGPDSPSAGFLIPDHISPKVYEEVVNSYTVLYATYESVKEKKLVAEGELPRFDVFVNLLEASVSALDQTTRPIQYSPVVTLRAHWHTAEVARALVSVWGEEAMKMAKEANRVQYGGLAGTLETQAKARKVALEAAWRSLEKEKAEFDLAAGRDELSLLLSESVGLKKELEANERVASSAGAELGSIQKALEEEQPVIELFHSPSDDVFWLSEGGDTPSKTKGMIAEQKNQTYWSLREKEATASATLAAARGRIAKGEGQLESLTERQDGLREQLAQHEIAQRRLVTEEQLALSIYKRLGSAEAVVSEIGRSMGGVDGDSSFSGLKRLSDVAPVEKDLSVTSLLFVPAFTLVAMFTAAAVFLLPAFIGHIQGAASRQGAGE